MKNYILNAYILLLTSGLILILIFSFYSKSKIECKDKVICNLSESKKNLLIK